MLVENTLMLICTVENFIEIKMIKCSKSMILNALPNDDKSHC